MAKKRCFVIMPFGEKPDIDGKVLDFEKVYKYLIKPSLEAMKMDCIRCDEIGKPGWIHAQMIEHIYQDDVVVVDITTLNPNVFYELGARHALRASVTVLIRKKGTKLPFNIQGLNTIDYDSEDLQSVEEAKQKIGDFIRHGLKASKGDSLVHDVLPLRIGTLPKVLHKTETFVYPLVNILQKAICITTGDIQKIKDIDIWVSSENTNMQMARYFDRSVSSVIRYLGADKDQAGTVTKDTMVEELAKIVGHQTAVPPATVIATHAGQLKHTHSVKMIFHAAAVSGAIGVGYVPIPNLADCVTNALTKADSPEYENFNLKSILFPLMGTGTARGDLKTIVCPLIEAAIEYLLANRTSRIERVHFIARSEEELNTCLSVLDNSPTVRRNERTGSPPRRKRIRSADSV
jgi:O-acetyl-ADP-ribose deacetylase (regulator of RNase III)